MSLTNGHTRVNAIGNPLVTAIEQRISTNRFDASRSISDDRISELVRLATRAPTAFNLQNWRFIAVRTPKAKARLRKVAWDQAKVTDAAVTFIICGHLPGHEVMADRLRPSVEAGFMPPELVQGWENGAKRLYFEQPRTQRDEAVRTATFGAATLMFAAEALGLASGAMVGFDPDGVAREFTLARMRCRWCFSPSVIRPPATGLRSPAGLSHRCSTSRSAVSKEIDGPNFTRFHFGEPS